MQCLKCAEPLTPPKQRFCSSKCREKHWVEHNRARLRETVRKYRARKAAVDGRYRDAGPKAIELRAWMIELKSKPCADCAQTFEVCCMDFDHREGTVKSNNLGTMFSNHHSRILIQAELDKCDLVCANCHRIRTRDRRIGKPRVKAQH